MDIDQYLAHARRSPRLTTLFARFASLADGRSGVPRARPLAIDQSLVGHDASITEFHGRYCELAGPFTAHFAASVPGAVEEECRVGTAIWLASHERRNRTGRPFALYTIGSADAVVARTAASLSPDTLRAIACSPNFENARPSHGVPPPPYFTFFHGPFYELVGRLRSKGQGLGCFSDGFDLILEDTTFQMYSSERLAPLRLLKPLLKRDGLVLLVEKLRHPDPREYERREEQKDRLHKALYFTPEEVAEKQESVLSIMYEQQVTLESLCADLRTVFTHCALIWNCGNFHSVIASDSSDALLQFVSLLTPQAVPRTFAVEAVPRALFGLENLALSHRYPTPRPFDELVDELCGR